MASFRVTVTATATTIYSVEVDAKDEQEAERMACSSNIYAVASDAEFGVEHGRCSFDTVAEQLTAECPDCGVTHAVPHDGLRLCHCGEFLAQSDVVVPLHKRVHLIVDGVCAPAPWWWQDQEVCAACGAKIEAEEVGLYGIQ